MPFRQRHKEQRGLLDDLEKRELVTQVGSAYVLTLAGLQACASPEARRLLEVRNELIPCLQDAYKQDPARAWELSALERVTNIGEKELIPALRVLSYEPGQPVEWVSWQEDYDNDARGIELNDRVLDLQVSALPAEERRVEGAKPQGDVMHVRTIEINGYRPFSGFSASLGDLTVIIGANAAGKSSLCDFLRFVAHVAQAPIPTEIDPRTVGKTLFHAGGKERISFAIKVDGERVVGVRYEAEILGPVGSVRVASERLLLLDVLDAPPQALLDFRNGKGTVRDLSNGAASWNLPPNELALRRVLDPRLATISSFQGFVASWRFYGGFDTSPNATMRHAVHTDDEPTLAEDGSNLSAVLHWLLLSHPDAWGELKSYLRGCIPGFDDLAVKPRGKGMVIGTWREEGVGEELTLADLSDGTLRLLCWLALAVSPNPPPLMCLDEPEVGLHPRALPVLAGALEVASARSQILVATHSPHFLSQFKLDDIAVMRKEGGHAVFVRPSSSDALRKEVEEIGGEAIARLFISDELEALP